MEGEQPTLLVLSEHQYKQEKEEWNFRRLYDQVLDCFHERMEDFEIRMNTAITAIIQSWDRGNRLGEVDLNDWYIAAGYVYRYGPHGAGLTRCKVLEALQNCTELQCILEEKMLKMISLGGGPANDAIGFCSALSRFQCEGQLKIQIVDSSSQWVPFIDKVTKLLMKDDFGDVSDFFKREKLKSLNFNTGKLPSYLVNVPLHEYNVVLICKLMNHLSLYEMDDLIQCLHANLKESAFVLLIDTQIIHKKWSQFFDFLYLSEEYQQYKSGTNVRRFGHNDRVTSKARIAVLKKKNQAADGEKNRCSVLALHSGQHESTRHA